MSPRVICGSPRSRSLRRSWGRRLPAELAGAERSVPGRCPGRAGAGTDRGRCRHWLLAVHPPRRSPSAAAAMAARGRCPECGSGSLVEDAHYAQQQLVCAACGCVVSEGLLTTTYTDEEHLRGAALEPGGSAGGVVQNRPCESPLGLSEAVREAKRSPSCVSVCPRGRFPSLHPPKHLQGFPSWDTPAALPCQDLGLEPVMSFKFKLQNLLLLKEIIKISYKSLRRALSAPELPPGHCLALSVGNPWLRGDPRAPFYLCCSNSVPSNRSECWSPVLWVSGGPNPNASVPGFLQD